MHAYTDILCTCCRRRSRSAERRRSRSVDRRRRPPSPIRRGGFGSRRGSSPYRRRSPPRRDVRRSRTPPSRRRRGRSSSTSSDSESDRDQRRRAAAEKKMRMFGWASIKAWRAALQTNSYWKPHVMQGLRFHTAEWRPRSLRLCSRHLTHSVPQNKGLVPHSCAHVACETRALFCKLSCCCLGKHSQIEISFKTNFLLMKRENSITSYCLVSMFKSAKLLWPFKEILVFWSFGYRLSWLRIASLTQTMDECMT